MVNSDSSLSPEKRLLQLIEEPKSESEKKGKKGQGIDWQRLLSPEALQARIVGFMDQAVQFVQRTRQTFGIKEINNGIKIIAVLFALISLTNLYFEMQNMNKDFLTSIAIPEKKMLDIVPQTGRVLDTSMFEEAQSRNIFVPYGKRAEEMSKQRKEASVKLLEMTKNLKLTGISYNPKDPAQTFCMIEDIEKNITTFLRIGDTISGLRVVSIDEENIVLQFQDETIEIR